VSGRGAVTAVDQNPASAHLMVEGSIDEVVDKCRFIAQNEGLTNAGKKSSTSRPLLLGITTASLSTDSLLGDLDPAAELP
jgi:hypothetical protein